MARCWIIQLFICYLQCVCVSVCYVCMEGVVWLCCYSKMLDIQQYTVHIYLALTAAVLYTLHSYYIYFSYTVHNVHGLSLLSFDLPSKIKLSTFVVTVFFLPDSIHILPLLFKPLYILIS